MKIITALFVLALVGCSDSYRYPCQDPENFGKPKCEPPACEADGTCTKDLMGQPK
jgi:hypothetical protein